MCKFGVHVTQVGKVAAGGVTSMYDVCVHIYRIHPYRIHYRSIKKTDTNAQSVERQKCFTRA